MGAWARTGKREAIPEAFKKGVEGHDGIRADLLAAFPAGEASLVDEVSRSGWYSSDEEEEEEEESTRVGDSRAGEVRKFSLGGLAGGSLKKSWMRKAGFFRTGSA